MRGELVQTLRARRLGRRLRGLGSADQGQSGRGAGPVHLPRRRRNRRARAPASSRSSNERARVHERNGMLALLIVLLLLGAGPAHGPEQGRHDHRHVHAHRAERPRRRHGQRGVGAAGRDRGGATTTRRHRPAGASRRSSTPTATGSPTSTTTTGAGLPVGGTRALFASVTALNSGDIDVRTVEQPLGTGERYTVSDVGPRPGLRPQYHQPLLRRPAGQLHHREDLAHLGQRADLQPGHHLPAERARGPHGLLPDQPRQRGPASAAAAVAIQYDPDPDTNGDNSALPAEQATDDFPVPILFRLGLACPSPWASSSVLVLVDGLHPNDNSESANLGVEWSLARLLVPARRLPDPLPDRFAAGLDLRLRGRGRPGQQPLPVRLRLGRARLSATTPIA